MDSFTQHPIPNTRHPKNLFITGTPGVGKTTLIKEATLPYRDKLGGFYTEELREGKERRGFILKVFPSVNGGSLEGILAQKGLKSSAKVGKYGVDLSVLDGLGVAALKKTLSMPGRLLVIDEIGSMEILSELFRATLVACLQSEEHPVLATIRQNAQPFTNELKRMNNVEMVRLTRENYPEVKKRTRGWIEEKLA